MVSVISHGAIELNDNAMNQTYFMNGQCIKHYYGEHTSKDKEVIDLANDE